MAKVNATSQGVKVSGLNELSRALRTVEGGLRGELKEANLEAAQMVTEESRAAAYALGGVVAKTAPHMRASAGFNRAGVTLGGAAPFALGAAFGGGRRRTTQQFKPWLGKVGYFLYPQIRQNAERIADIYEDRIDNLIRRAGF